MLRPPEERRRPVRDAAAFVLLAHRDRARSARSNFPIGMNPGLAKALGCDDEARFRARRVESRSRNRGPSRTIFPPGALPLRRIPALRNRRRKRSHGDEKFFSLSSQPKCIPIVATQSISSLRSALPGESWRTLLQTFRTKIFLTLSDDFSARRKRTLRPRRPVQTQLQLLRKRARCPRQPADRQGPLPQGQHHRFEELQHAERLSLRHEDVHGTTNAQAIIIAYDGLNPMPPMFCYLKPYYNDPNKSYFQQLAEGAL